MRNKEFSLEQCFVAFGKKCLIIKHLLIWNVRALREYFDALTSLIIARSIQQGLILVFPIQTSLSVDDKWRVVKSRVSIDCDKNTP